MLARDDWIPKDPEEPSFEAAYSRADVWLRTLTLVATFALAAVASFATFAL